MPSHVLARTLGRTSVVSDNAFGMIAIRLRRLAAQAGLRIDFLVADRDVIRNGTGSTARWLTLNSRLMTKRKRALHLEMWRVGTPYTYPA